MIKLVSRRLFISSLNGLQRRQMQLTSTVKNNKAQQQPKRDPDEPVRFSTSNAAKWDAMDTFLLPKIRQMPKSQPFFVIVSSAVFLIYFLVLREENQLDQTMMRPLEDVVPHLKEKTLKAQIKHYESLGMDTSELKKALQAEIAKRPESLKSL